MSLFESLVPQIYFQQLAYLQNFVLIHIDKPHLSNPPPSSFHIFYFVFFFSSDQHLAFILRRTFCRHTISQNIKLRRTSTFWKLSFWRYCNRPWQTYCFPPDIHVSKNTLFLLFKLYYRGDHGEETKNEDKLCSQWFR